MTLLERARQRGSEDKRDRGWTGCRPQIILECLSKRNWKLEKNIAVCCRAYVCSGSGAEGDEN